MKFKEFKKESRLKPWDSVIILALILCSFIPVIIFYLQQKEPQPADKQAVLRIDGEEIRRFDLVEGQKGYTYKYTDKDGEYNLIEIKGDQIRIKEANCGDQICVRRGWAKKNGETIVCLPHKLVLEVNDAKTDDGGETDDLIY
ncbi:MAG TPA: NusG domain II-containing protein [Tetragenococcus sp.]|nr:NusG domain II-containing protein [Tetragenococcus sp.]